MIIDTETHVIFRMYPKETNPASSLVEPWSWHELGGDLLVAEMDRAGVDKAILISYGAENLHAVLREGGHSDEDFISGKAYHKLFFRKYPGRFFWFATIPDPRLDECLETVAKDFEEGASGIKIFPALVNMNLDDPKMLGVMDLVSKKGKLVILGLEEGDERTPPLGALHRQLDSILARYPNVRFQLNHGGCVDPFSSEAEPVFQMARKHDNLFISTAFLGYKRIDKGYAFDGHEYPFPGQLSMLKKFYEQVGPDRLMFGTDWPWVEHVRKYVQDIDSVRKHADFMSAADKEKFLGLNAMRYLGLEK